MSKSTMNTSEHNGFSRRERQIMEIVYRLGKATARDIHEALPNAPSYTSVRTLLRAMLYKGYLEHHQEGVRYVYSPVVPRTKAGSSALRNVLTNFFAGNPQDLIATLIDEEASNLSDDDLEQITALIENARQEGR